TSGGDENHAVFKSKESLIHSLS
ncbi:MAG: hypothetical protein RL656_270, partial [Bacteroidota bacterium]